MMNNYLKALPLALALIAGSASANTDGFQFQDIAFNSNHIAKGAFAVIDDGPHGYVFYGYFKGIHPIGADHQQAAALYNGYEFMLTQDSEVTFTGKYIPNVPSIRKDYVWVGFDDHPTKNEVGGAPMYENGSASYTQFLSAGQHQLWLSVGNNSLNGYGSFILNAQPVPEPETYALMGLGLVGLLVARKRKQVS